jgi:hypothetical protein
MTNMKERLLIVGAFLLLIIMSLVAAIGFPVWLIAYVLFDYNINHTIDKLIRYVDD